MVNTKNTRKSNVNKPQVVKRGNLVLLSHYNGRTTCEFMNDLSYFGWLESEDHEAIFSYVDAIQRMKIYGGRGESQDYYITVPLLHFCGTTALPYSCKLACAQSAYASHDAEFVFKNGVIMHLHAGNMLFSSKQLNDIIECINDLYTMRFHRDFNISIEKPNSKVDILCMTPVCSPTIDPNASSVKKS